MEESHSQSTVAEIDEKAHALLRRFYGYKSFKPGQLEVIRSIASGRDTLVLMPTGGGKSVCYQIPAMILKGCCIVVSPLISLMNDQVTGLNAIGIPAAAIHSGNNDIDNREAIEGAVRGHIKLLYMSPERLMLELQRGDISRWVSFVAVDEAHCISQWGHDFRPEYAQLSAVRKLVRNMPVIALTATADKLTREDIASKLELHDPLIHIASFDRPNLSLSVVSGATRKRKLALIQGIADRYPDDSGIIYCLSRKGAEKMAAEMEMLGYKTGVYHAGLSSAERDRTQNAFIAGDLQVVCATVAFGMGIDKSNIRWVVHNNMPQNMEGYYQEIGRAGRDGAPAETMMFYSFADVATIQSFIEESGNPEFNAEKLNRMKEYCESSVCRRRVLLSYFNETLDHDCGNCDVCLNPPERFDGTVFAQMALSAIARTGEKVGATMLVDVLRGSARAEVIQRGFDKIKTYGVGRMASYAEWNSYLGQMLQLGLFDVAYNDSNHLKITPYGRSVLKGEEKVMLARFYPDTPKKKGARTKQQSAAAPVNPAEALFKELKALRMELAKKENIPPYLVFTDKTLMEMVRHRPVTLREFNAIDGVGEKKSVKYWSAFTSLIKKFR